MFSPPTSPVTGVIGDDSLSFKGMTGTQEYNLLREVAKLRKFGSIYTGFNQSSTIRYSYACVIVAYLRAYTTLFNIGSEFNENMSELCDYCEAQGTWKEGVGGYVVEMGNSIIEYLNRKYPNNRVILHRIDYGTGLMGTALERNIPVVTAYWSSEEYYSHKKDGVISEKEARAARALGYGHCITITGLGYFWSYLNMQDNYEGDPSNQYKIFGFRWLLNKVWQKNTFFILLPEDIKRYQKR